MRNAPDLADIQRDFTDALPRIEGLASAYLGFMQRDKEDAVAEVVALSWRAYQDLALRGQDVVRLLGKIVEFAAKRVRCGRGLTNINPARDVLSQVARFTHRHVISTLPTGDDETAPEVIEALRDHRSPADQAVMRTDYEAWIERLDDYRRDVAEKLASGLNTADVAKTRGVSRARIAQIRVQLIREWERFNGSEARLQ